MDNFDYGFDLNEFISNEFETGFDSEARDFSEVDLLVREFEDWDEEYVEFNEETFDL